MISVILEIWNPPPKVNFTQKVINRFSGEKPPPPPPPSGFDRYKSVITNKQVENKDARSNINWRDFGKIKENISNYKQSKDVEKGLNEKLTRATAVKNTNDASKQSAKSAGELAATEAQSAAYSQQHPIKAGLKNLLRIGYSPEEKARIYADADREKYDYNKNISDSLRNKSQSYNNANEVLRTNKTTSQEEPKAVTTGQQAIPVGSAPKALPPASNNNIPIRRPVGPLNMDELLRDKLNKKKREQVNI